VLRLLLSVIATAFLTVVAQGVAVTMEVKYFGPFLWGADWDTGNGLLRALFLRLITFAPVFACLSCLICLVATRFSFALVSLSGLYLTLDNLRIMRFEGTETFFEKVEIYILFEFPYVIPIPVMWAFFWVYRRWVWGED
jgi:hypothetical protein